MSSGRENLFETLFKQEATINKLIVDGKRDPAKVIKVLQTIIQGGSEVLIPDVLSIDLTELISSWERHLKKFYRIKFPFSKVRIPELQEGFNWIVPCPTGLRENQIYEVLSKKFLCSRYTDDLDKEIVWNKRGHKENYIIRIRDRVEADEELQNLSAEGIKEKRIKTMTLRERMLLEGWYFDQTGEHLDIKNITLCVGSRGSVGPVPCAFWYGGRFEVGWYAPRDAHSRLRVRAAVS